MSLLFITGDPRVRRTAAALLVAFLALAGGARRSSGDQAQELHLGDSATRDLRGGQTHPYVLNVAAGEFVRLLVEQADINVNLHLLGPTGACWPSATSAMPAKGPNACSSSLRQQAATPSR